MATPPKGRADYLELGDYNAMCAQCGRKRKASELMKLPKGTPGGDLYVCLEHWEPRQPQDFVKGEPVMPPPWVQPWPADNYTFVSDPLITEASNVTLGPLDYITTEAGEILYTES